MAVEGIETPCGGVEAKAALAGLANDDAGNLISLALDRISFGHDYPMRRQCRRPLAVRCRLGVSAPCACGRAVSNTAAAIRRQWRGFAQRSCRRSHRVIGCSSPAESTKTPRGTLAFDAAAQARCRNHRGGARTNSDAITLTSPRLLPDQVVFKCLCAAMARNRTPVVMRTAARVAPVHGRTALGQHVPTVATSSCNRKVSAANADCKAGGTST